MSDSPFTDHQVTPRHYISADGKCSEPVELDESIETLEIVIDGNSMKGGSDTPTLLDISPDFLPASKLYKLNHFEPLSDGRCLLRYSRL